MSELFRLALVGVGLITQEAHLPAALSSDRVKVTALVDPTVERASLVARRFGIAPRIAASVDDVLDVIDGAIVATPNDTHQDIAVRCLKAGIATLVEKPLASSVAEGQAILDAAREGGATLAVGYVSRFRDSTVLLKQLLDQNYFGAVRRFVHQFGTTGGWAPLSAYNLKRSSPGGGVLTVTGTHFLDRMLHFWGSPDHSRLVDDSLGGPEANCTAYFSYGRKLSTMEGMARYSKTFQLPAGLAIDTERGRIVVRDTDDADLLFYPVERPDLVQVLRNSAPVQPAGSTFQRQIEDFVDACRQRRAPRVDGAQGLLSLQLLEDLYRTRQGFNQEWYETDVNVANRYAEVI